MKHKKEKSQPLLNEPSSAAEEILASKKEIAYKNTLNNKKNIKRFYLGDKFPGIFLSAQEAKCLICFMEGKSNQATAEILGLSTQTILFHEKNIQAKIPSQTREELFKLIHETDFVKFIQEIRSL